MALSTLRKMAVNHPNQHVKNFATRTLAVLDRQKVKKWNKAMEKEIRRKSYSDRAKKH